MVAVAAAATMRAGGVGVAAVAALLALMPLLAQAIAIDKVRQLAAKNNVTCVLVFGDSSVDPGNNNVLQTTVKSNFLPYGRDFLDGHPTGRFCNGRLATDFIGKRSIRVPLLCYFQFMILLFIHRNWTKVSPLY